MNLAWWVRGRGTSGIFLFNCVRQSYFDISEKSLKRDAMDLVSLCSIPLDIMELGADDGLLRDVIS